MLQRTISPPVSITVSFTYYPETLFDESLLEMETPNRFITTHGPEADRFFNRLSPGEPAKEVIGGMHYKRVVLPTDWIADNFPEMFADELSGVPADKIPINDTLF